jgi:hypothetical protein
VIVYHVTSARKLARYKKAGYITPPVRAWRTIAAAERFSLATGRQVIMRLRFPDDANTLDGHRGEAVYVTRRVNVTNL